MSDLTTRLILTSGALLVGVTAWHLFGFAITVIALLSVVIGGQGVRS